MMPGEQRSRILNSRQQCHNVLFCVAGRTGVAKRSPALACDISGWFLRIFQILRIVSVTKRHRVYLVPQVHRSIDYGLISVTDAPNICMSGTQYSVPNTRHPVRNRNAVPSTQHPISSIQYLDMYV